MRNKLSVVPARERTELERVIEDYLSDLQARGRSRRTLRQAGYVLGSVFLPWCREQGTTGVQQLDQKALNAWSTHLLEQGGPRGALSRPSAHSYGRAVNQLLSWTVKAGQRQDQAKGHLPKLERRVIDVLDRKELKALEEAARTDRDRLLITLLASTGLRLSEALGLRDEDLQEQGRGRFVKVHGKGQKQRLVPISPALYNRIRDYAKKRRPKDVATSHVFTGLRRRPDGSYSRLTARTVQDMVAQAAQDAGLEGRKVTPHMLRHSYATNALRSGMNVIALKDILGHADLSQISATYSHLAAGDLFEAAMKAERGEELR
jgi:integrase/recombinase XerD